MVEIAAARILQRLPADGGAISAGALLDRLQKDDPALDPATLDAAIEMLARLHLLRRDRDGALRRAGSLGQIDRVASNLGEILAELATTLIYTSPGDMALRIAQTLRRVTEFVGADRGYVFDYDWQRSEAIYSHEWCAEGISPQIDIIGAVPMNEIGDWVSAHRKGESVVIDDVAAWPEKQVREILQAQDIVSTAAVPMMHEGLCLGFVGFDSVRQPRHYTEQELRLLRVLAQMLVNLRLHDDERRALEQERNRLGIIVEGTAAGTWIWRLDSGQLEINELWAGMLGYTRAELEPVDIATWDRLSHPGDLAQARAVMDRNVSGELDYFEAVVRMRHKAGHWVWVLTRGRVMQRDAQGRGLVAAGIHQDITGGETARQRLLQLSAIIQRSPVVAFRWHNSPGWPVEFVSENVEQFGYRPQDFLSGGVVYSDLIHPDDLGRIQGEVAKHLAEGPDNYRQTYRLRHHDGRWLWIEDFTWLTRGEDGVVTEINGVIWDITRRKETETEFERNERALRNAQRIARLGHWEMDLETGLAEVSDAVLEIFAEREKRRRPDFQTFLESVHPEDRDKVGADFDRMLQQPDVVYNDVEHRIVTGDRQVKWVRQQAEIIRDADGRPLRLFGTVQDITARKTLEQERESQAAIIDNSADVAILRDADLRLVSVNKAYLELIGRPRSEVIGRRVEDLLQGGIPPDLLAQYSADARKALALKPGESMVVEDRFPLPDGSERLFRTRHFPVYRRDEGSFLGIATLAVEITELKRAEAGLAESEARFRTIFERSPLSIIIRDKDTGAVIDANRAAYEGYGLKSVDELRQNEIWGPPPYSFEDALARVRKAAAEGTQTFEWQGRRADGTTLWKRVTLTPVVLNRVERVLAISIDITARVEAERALADSEARFRAIFEKSPVSILVHDANTGEALEANEQALRFYSVDSIEALGDVALWNQKPPYSAEDALAWIRKAATEGRQAFEWRTTRGDGSEAWESVTLDLIRLGGAERVLAISIDISERIKAEQALSESEQRFRGLVENVPNIAVQGFDADLKVIFWNRGSEMLYGYTSDEAVGRSVMDLIIPPEMHEMVREQAKSWAAGEAIDEAVELDLVTRDGRPVSVYSSNVKRITPGGAPEFYSLDVDLTEQKQSRQRLELWASVFTHSHDGIIITDGEGRILEVNDIFCGITGYDRSEVVGQNPSFLKSGRQSATFYDGMWQRLKDFGFWSGELWNAKKSGEHYAQHLTISAVADAGGKVINYVGIFSDITAQLTYRERLERIAHFDELTGLPNRAVLSDSLREAIQAFPRREQPLAVVYIDLDGFKAINDEHGHEVGDRYLCAIAERLRTVLRGGDVPARIGGDEFVLLVHDLGQSQPDHPFFERLVRELRKPVRVGGTEMAVSASIGVTFYPQPGEIDADQLLRQADQAMYIAKKSGKNRITFFDAELERQAQAHLAAVERFRQAITNGELRLHYQPKVDMRQGRVVGVEALLRWEHPQDGLLFPARFLDLLRSDEGLMQRIGNWVIAQALDDLRQLRGAGHEPGVSVNVNLSTQPTLQRSFLGSLEAALKAHGDIDPALVTLEILESTFIEDFENAAAAIEAVRALGVGLSLDDFGTGYSSLAYLKHLPLNEIKIDQSFVRDMLRDREDLSIVQGIIGLAQAFDIPVVAEGVETEEHAELLLRLGCNRAQGYAFARPMPLDALAAWLDNWRPAPGWADIRAVAPEWRGLLALRAVHRDWMERLDAYVEAGRADRPEPDPHDCGFDRALAMLGDLKQRGVWRDELEALHDRLHRQADGAVAALRRGDQEKARAGLARARKTGDRLSARLLQIADDPPA